MRLLHSTAFALLLLTSRRHIDLARTSSAMCRPA
ncbi:putative leader peptide [Streptomyces sp. NPDC004830]